MATKREVPAMSDKMKIIAGLAVFVVLATFPLWYMRVAGGVDTPPELEPPAGALLFTADWVTVGAGNSVDLHHAFFTNPFSTAVRPHGDTGTGEGLEYCLTFVCQKALSC